MSSADTRGFRRFRGHNCLSWVGAPQRLRRSRRRAVFSLIRRARRSRHVVEPFDHMMEAHGHALRLLDFWGARFDMHFSLRPRAASAAHFFAFASCAGAVDENFGGCSAARRRISASIKATASTLQAGCKPKTSGGAIRPSARLRAMVRLAQPHLAASRSWVRKTGSRLHTLLQLLDSSEAGRGGRRLSSVFGRLTQQLFD